MPEEREGWHLSKNVPIAIIVTIVLQGGFGIWYAAKLDSRVEVNERHLILVQEDVKDLQAGDRRQALQLNTIETDVKTIKENVNTLVNRSNN